MRLHVPRNHQRQFQFTHPRGVRFDALEAAGITVVSIHAPTRGAIGKLRQPFCEIGFNSRTHAGCDMLHRQRVRTMLFQFTHPRGVRFGGLLEFPHGGVSIHAPTRGAMSHHGRPQAIQGFNSRTHAGCDESIAGGISNVWFQFTHPRGVRLEQFNA
ncbi:hypothetical protein SAMN05720468_10415 [Fibrobacter sp. UWEL]|nr:hypothetical protein SAMN05720468_10415 [Fibrobacter sp. UWEL]